MLNGLITVYRMNYEIRKIKKGSSFNRVLSSYSLILSTIFILCLQSIAYFKINQTELAKIL